MSLGKTVSGEDFSALTAMGGIRGIVEALVPSTLFLVLLVTTSKLGIAVIGALASAVVAALIRLFQRSSLLQVFSGLIGIGICAGWAWYSQRSENFFAAGLWTNAIYASALLASIIARYPAITVLVALARSETKWRKDPRWALARKRAEIATWLWICLFALRLGTQIPLYLAGDVVTLGTLRLIMGLPLFAFVAWITWMLLRTVLPQPQNQEADLAQNGESPSA